MDSGRKRQHSHEKIVRQSKLFVTDRLVRERDENIMNEIYKNTFEKMLAAANPKRKCASLEQSRGNSLDSEDDEKNRDTVEDKLPDRIKCKLCINDITQSAGKICSNCCLKVCHRCAAEQCYYCNAILCSSCVNIFGCSIESMAVCEECKSLMIS